MPHDAPDEFRNGEIIHDKDVRDIVNLLLGRPKSGGRGSES